MTATLRYTAWWGMNRLRTPIDAAYYTKNWTLKRCIALQVGLSVFSWIALLTGLVFIAGRNPMSAILLNPREIILGLYGPRLPLVVYLFVAVPRLFLIDPVSYHIGLKIGHEALGSRSRLAGKVLERPELGWLAYAYVFLKHGHTSMVIVGAQNKPWHIAAMINPLGTVTYACFVYYIGKVALQFI